MSYRLIIADDEPKIIELIKQLGHWKELDIEIVDECRNGKQAYESIIKNNPDFVFSDIKMPVYDGIELIRRVREVNPDPLFVLISGYRHFEYARSAVSLNVMDYLLKPIDERQLNETLVRVCRRVDQLRIQKQQEDEMCSIREAKSRQEMEVFWNLFIIRQNPDRRVFLASEEACNKRFHTDFTPGCYQVLSMFSDLSAVLGQEDSLSNTKVAAFIRESFQNLGLVYYHTTYMGIVMVVNFREEDKKAVRQAISVLYYNIRDLSELYGEFRLNIGVSSVKYSISDLYEGFVEAHAAEWGRLVLTRNGILDYHQIEGLPRFSRNRLFTDDEQETIRDCIKYLRREELSDVFDRLYRRAGELSNSYPDDILNAFFSLQHGLAVCFEEGEERLRFMENFYYAYLNGKNFPQVMKNVYLTLEKYLDEEQKKLKEKMGKPITMAVRYIRENYGKQISLEDVASDCNVSGNYLSRLFKDEMGIGFNEFLTQVRLEESEKLLAETNLTIKEIAAMVGYLDEKYYSKLFKKVTGIKPTEYRRIYS
ncbi:MAG: AraC family transcriptional regulator [Lachnospiraceae bacterium]|nr:AraC family transcriptional regulator [Lachnospiraceae bacterium]